MLGMEAGSGEAAGPRPRSQERADRAKGALPVLRGCVALRCVCYKTGEQAPNPNILINGKQARQALCCVNQGSLRLYEMDL